GLVPGGESACRQQREGGQRGQHVRRQLRARKTEEHDDRRRPDKEEAVDVDARGKRLFARAAAARERGDGERRPGRRADEHARKEVPPGCAPVIPGQRVAREVLVDEEELEELWVPRLGEREPRTRNRRE